MSRVFAVPGYDRDDLHQEKQVARLTAAQGYARRAVKLHLIDLLRSATRGNGRALNGATELLDPMHPACTDDARLEARELLRDARRLPNEQFRIVVLFALGFSYAEIGEREGLRPKQVDNRLREAREALRRAA